MNDDQLILEAQIHAQEARTANATIAEIYQIVTGKTGEPGNWNGAKPVRKTFADLRAKLADATETLESIDDLAYEEGSQGTMGRLAAKCLKRLQRESRRLNDNTKQDGSGY